MGTELEGDDELIWQDEYAYDLAGNRTQKAHTESLGNGDLELTLRHYKYNQANQLILEWKEEGTVTTATVAGEVWDEESGLAKLTLNGVTPSMWGDYFYGQAPPSNGMVFLLAEDHVKNQTLIAVNVSTGLSDFVGYSYDENGNLVERLSEEGPTVYQWDHRNRLTKVIHPDGQETAYEYCPACPLGKVSKMTRADGSTVDWVWDGISFLREKDSQDALPMEYFGGVAVKREGAWYYLAMDVMGTVWQVTDEAGAVVNEFQWDAWGNELTGTFGDGSAVCQMGWQGKRWDKEQGLFYSVARWYDQRLGRFTQPDPAEGLGIVTTGGEGYGWPGRNPVLVSDPSGLKSITYSEFLKLLKANNKYQDPLTGEEREEEITCIAYIESGFEGKFKVDAENDGARGLMQIRRGACKDVKASHEDMFDPAKNIQTGTKYLLRRQKYFSGEQDLFNAVAGVRHALDLLDRRWDGLGFQEQKRLLYFLVERVGYDRQSVKIDFREGAFEALVKETRNLKKRMGVEA